MRLSGGNLSSLVCSVCFERNLSQTLLNLRHCDKHADQSVLEGTDFP